MKNYMFGLLTALVIGAVGFFAYQAGTAKQPLVPPAALTPPAATAAPLEPTDLPAPSAPSVTPNPAAEEPAIRQALIDKYNWNPDDMIITISKNTGTYAGGGSRSKIAEAGGGYFFAAKVNGVWKIVADGNGTISCESLAPYPDFPASMIPECWNEATGKLITR